MRRRLMRWYTRGRWRADQISVGGQLPSPSGSALRGIADDVLRDLFKRGKYSDVVLPMCVIRRMDATLGSI